jgi:hypothetical protein
LVRTSTFATMATTTMSTTTSTTEDSVIIVSHKEQTEHNGGPGTLEEVLCLMLMKEDLEAFRQPSTMTLWLHRLWQLHPFVKRRCVSKRSLKWEGPRGKDLHTEKVLETKIYATRSF